MPAFFRPKASRASKPSSPTSSDKSGIQLVVATVPTLDGEEIEPYANGLFRFWKLGEAKENNGVLLLVAPKEHKMRIEVGYGLEGTLTDAHVEAHHRQRHGAALQDRRLRGRHRARASTTSSRC